MKTKGVLAVILAYPAAALVGAAIVALGFAAMATVLTLINGLDWHEIMRGLWVVPAALLYAFCIFIIGLVVIGTPAWLVLVRLHRIARRDAVIAGAVLSMIPVAVFLFMDGEPVLRWEPWAFIASIAIPGAASGWTLHRIAYGR